MQHDDLSSLVIEASEGAPQEVASILRLLRLVRHVGRSLQHFFLTAPTVRCHLARDAEEPRAYRSIAIPSVPSSVDHDKHVVHGVVEVVRSNTETPERLPDVFQLAFIEEVERMERGTRRAVRLAHTYPIAATNEVSSQKRRLECESDAALYEGSGPGLPV
ncbi:MAG TPA: hypothetical protein VGM90_33390 [Kofleriaceae bacterium]